MKAAIHPENYRPVVFRDTNSGATFLTRSTAPSTETIKLEDGQQYPVVDIHISSASHPFYTGKEKLVDIEGRVDRFKARSQRGQEMRAKAAAKHVKEKSRQTAKQAKRAAKKS